MEVFKYITEAHLDHIKTSKFLIPRQQDGFTYALPEDPLIWGVEHTKEILEHLRRHSGVSPIVLIRFAIDMYDKAAFVQEGSEDVYFKFLERRPLWDYVSKDYRLPEVVIRRSIAFQDIKVIPMPNI